MGPRDTGCWLAQLYYYMRVSLSNWIEKCNIGIDHTPIYLNTITIVSCLYAWERCNIYCYTNMSNGRRYCNKTIQCYFAPWLRLSLVTSKSLYKSSMNPYVDCFFVFFHGCFHRKTMVKCQCSVPCLMVKSQRPIIFDGYTMLYRYTTQDSTILDA